VLETYAEAYDPQQPVVCMDEQPVQLLKETEVPIAATKKHAKRVDYEYERNGTASIFMFAEPLSGFRQATARERRTKVDWAIEVAQLLDTRYARCAKVTLVCDNLNTHTKGAFYTAFPPEKARAYIKRINFCHTPNAAEPQPKSVFLTNLVGSIFRSRFGSILPDLAASMPRPGGSLPPPGPLLASLCYRCGEIFARLLSHRLDFPIP
jgi:DDE superfamily endonuclease